MPALSALYRAGTIPRYGEVVMIAGRSGAMKSMFALWFADQLALPTLYLSADMGAFTAATRIASSRLGVTTSEVEAIMAGGGPERDRLLAEIGKSNITFSFGSPITWWQIEQELDAFVELHDEYPAVLVVDNLMDFEMAETDYHVQYGVMSGLTELSRDTGISPWVLHHASDKTENAKNDPGNPPARHEIKNGIAEKPELCLGIAYDDRQSLFKIATLKQRMGKSDPSGRHFISLKCEAEFARFSSRNL